MPRLVLIDFYSAWCEPCREQTAAVDEVAGRLGEAVEVRKVDVAERRDLVSAYRLTTVPTIVIEMDGKVVKRLERPADAETLESLLNSLTDDHETRGRDYEQTSAD
ncbi:thiol reductase thioredoxin [Methanofollis formosanus]|uniref:Thiol reductase thioredoxin n=1 Tax=Methanofollis formosanus TaxID=299308 RepID=A0A8G1EFL1_9EURY|nr:thioredoxin domain-containing protein [Methanofollis formosanus]QYZ78254.1 thiol reductase thioredoxin [Methanofollis formosanus]